MNILHIIPSSAFWYAKFQRTIYHAHRVGRNVHHGGHAGYFASAHIEHRAVPWANHVIVFDVAIAKWAVVVCAHIANGIILSANVKNHDWFIFNFEKHALAIGQIDKTKNNKNNNKNNKKKKKKQRKKPSHYHKCLVYKIVACFAQTVHPGFEYLQRKQGAFQAHGAKLNAKQIKHILLVEADGGFL